jgi:ribosome-associated protein|tara:strand:+ start:389 stop:811 length:423 start_codon:yes stop_codon:yes gene_type:complete
MTDSTTNTTVLGDDEVQVVELIKQPIDLFKILKFEGLVASGGEAKAAIADGLVTLNAAVETQKRKKIVSGDIIEFDGVSYRMHCGEAIGLLKSDGTAADENENKKDVIAAGKPVRKSTVNTKRKTPAPSRAGRKAIGIKS